MTKPLIAMLALAGASYTAGIILSDRAAEGSDDEQRVTAIDVGHEENGCDDVEVPQGMVCIPGGPAVIGSDTHAAQSPQHEVEVSRFFIDAREITNAEYRACIEAGGCPPPRKHPPRRYRALMADDLPAVPITWYMARKYCVWAGKRLPTEAEWEKAARGGLQAREYPWGGEPPTCERAHFKDCLPRSPHPVASLPAGAYGLHDMAGNGYEWVHDWASDCYAGCARPCGDDCRGLDPQGPCSGAPLCKRHSERVLKGGAWNRPAAELRGAHRRSHHPSSGLKLISFRCATSTPVLTRAPYWHNQRREPPPAPEPPSEEELATFAAVDDDSEVLKIGVCDREGKATHECRDPMSYYKSNEWHRPLFGPFIENLGGGYVGLGADQSYDFVSHAKSRWAWIFDYDPAVVRIHYAIRAAVLNTETPAAFVDAFRFKSKRRLRRWIRASLAHRPDEIHPTFAVIDEYRGRLVWHYNRILEPRPRRFPRFGWLAYQQNFDYVRTMFAQGRVLIRKGNLLNNVVLPDIAESAEALGVPIRVYYDSNAPEQWKLIQQYRDNIIRLPFDEESVVLRTLHGTRWSVETKWLYVVHGGQHMQRKLRLNNTEYLVHLMTESQKTDIDSVRVIGLPVIDVALLETHGGASESALR